MHHMVLLVLDDLDHAADVLDAWENAGVHGITIIESTGLGRMRRARNRPREMPLMPSLRSLLQTQEEPHRTMFSVVEGEEMVDALIRATESIVGALNEPNKGVIFVLPVTKVVGMGNMRIDD